MASALAQCHLLGLCCLCPREDAASFWQPSLAMPTGPETLPRQAVPSNLPVKAAMRPLLQGQLSSGWLPRGPANAGNCVAELRGAQNSQWSLRGDLPASSLPLALGNIALDIHSWMADQYILDG